jgi:hypothetical protein
VCGSAVVQQGNQPSAGTYSVALSEGNVADRRNFPNAFVAQKQYIDTAVFGSIRLSE